jgi:acetyl-CoA acetyltransferase
VAVKKHHHGVKNPRARLRFEITMEQALNAPTVVSPFRLYDCAPQSDGAAARVIAAEDVVDRFTDRPVCNRGVGLGRDSVMPGATGVAQCVELFQQLRGEAVDQVDGARIALAHNIGGPTAVPAVTILEGSGGLN